MIDYTNYQSTGFRAFVKGLLMCHGIDTDNFTIEPFSEQSDIIVDNQTVIRDLQGNDSDVYNINVPKAWFLGRLLFESVVGAVDLSQSDRDCIGNIYTHYIVENGAAIHERILTLDGRDEVATKSSAIDFHVQLEDCLLTAIGAQSTASGLQYIVFYKFTGVKIKLEN